VPSRARFLSCLVVGGELAVGDVGEAPPQAAHRFHGPEFRSKWAYEGILIGVGAGRGVGVVRESRNSRRIRFSACAQARAQPPFGAAARRQRWRLCAARERVICVADRQARLCSCL
jgi:hypothetical protein